MISHKYKCIFIHIPKAAGTSIEKKLGHFKELKRNVQDHSTVREIEPLRISHAWHLYRSDNLYLMAKKLKKKRERRNHVTIEQYNDYFKFTFIRNPWSRTYSWYKNVMRDDFHKLAHGITKDLAFKEFLIKYIDKSWALQSQLFWLQDMEGNIPMNFIGRFENLEEDFKKVANILDINDATLPKFLTGSTTNYTEAYDAEMIDIVANKYKQEIDLFRFKFGG